MLKLKAFYGQLNVFGICTTLLDWRFCWFPDKAECPNSASISKSRKLYGTRTFSVNEQELPKAILGTLLHSISSPFEKVPLLSSNRCYVKITTSTTSWEWDSLNLKDVARMNLTLEYPHRNTSIFYVLRFFHPGSDGKVAMIVSGSGNLAVIKTFADAEKYEQEKYNWETMLDRKLIHNDMKKSLIIPFCFHCLHDEELQKLEFSFDLTVWSQMNNNNRNANSLEDEKEDLSQYPLTRDIEECVNSMDVDPLSTAISAIHCVASKGFIHGDIEWRHVALLPVYEQSKLVSFQPMLIDLTSMKKAGDDENALLVMKPLLLTICDNYGLDTIEVSEKFDNHNNVQ
jgi:hypothetical protein